MSRALQNAGERLLYHIGPRPPSPNYRTGKLTPLGQGWTRHWLPDPVLSGVFLTPDPLAVRQFHGVSGNVYAALVPESVIRRSYGLHRYDEATEILVPENLWGQVKLLGKVMDEKTLLQTTRYKYSGPMLLEWRVPENTKSSAWWPGLKAGLWAEEKEERKAERRDKAKGRKGLRADLNREERKRMKRLEPARKLKSNPLLKPEPSVFAVVDSMRPVTQLYKTVNGEVHRLGRLKLELGEIDEPVKGDRLTGRWYPTSARALRGWGPLLYDVAATVLNVAIVPSAIQSPDALRFWSRQPVVLLPGERSPRRAIVPLTTEQFRAKYGVQLQDLLRVPVRENTALVPPAQVVEGPLSTQVLRVPNTRMWIGVVKDRHLKPVAMFGPADDVDELFPHLDDYVDQHETGLW